VAQGGLNFWQRCTTVDGMRAVGMPQPVRRHCLVDAGLGCRALHYSIDVALRKLATALRLGNTASLLPASAPKGEGAADDLGQQHLAHLAALTQDRQLHAVVARQDVSPGQGYLFGDAQASGVDQSTTSISPILGMSAGTLTVLQSALARGAPCEPRARRFAGHALCGICCRGVVSFSATAGNVTLSHHKRPSRCWRASSARRMRRILSPCP